MQSVLLSLALERVRLKSIPICRKIFVERQIMDDTENNNYKILNIDKFCKRFLTVFINGDKVSYVDIDFFTM